jgi:hypothetical protein
MKTISIVTVAVLSVALIIETIFFLQLSRNQQKFSYQVSSLQQDVKELEKSNTLLKDSQTLLENEKSKLLVNTGQLSQENETFSTEIAKKEEQIKSLTDDVGKLTTELDEQKASVSKLQTENNSLKSKFMCKKTLSSVDFTNNKSVNKSLVAFAESVNTRPEPISAHYWNLIWTGSKYSIHTIEVHSEKERTNYIWKFTVYFRGESYGDHGNGIFYNDDQCWLYLDK